MTDRKPDAQGDLSRYPWPRLLFYLYKKQFLGELTLDQPGGISGRVYFREGLPVFTDMPFSTDVLGRVLVERRLITEEHLYGSLQELAKGGQLQGQILIGMGVLDMGGLIEGLRLQLLRKLNRIFGLTEAAFGIYSGEHGRGMQGEEAQVLADPLWVIYHGVRNALDSTRMQQELDKLLGMSIWLPQDFGDIWPRYGMGDEVQNLVMLLMRGAVPIEKVFHWSDLGPVVTQMLLYSLWVTEALEASKSDGAQPRQPGPLTREAPATPQGFQPHPPQAQAPQLRTAPGVPQPQPRQTAPGVEALAAHFTGETDQGGMIDDNDVIEEIHRPPQEENTDGGTPIITSAPVHQMPKSTAPELGEEGVYEAPQKKPARAKPMTGPIQRVPSSPGLKRISSATGEPLRRVASSPGEPIQRVPSSPGQPIQQIPSAPGNAPADAGAAAEHYQLVKKTHKRIKEESYYDILGVEKNTTVEKIREAYFELAKDFHPDRVASLGITDVAKEAEEIFRFINEAHSTLSDRDKRIEYDEELKGQSKKKEVAEALQAEFAFQKGLVHFRKKSFPEAMKYFQEAYKLNPKEGEHLAYVAWALYSDPRSNKKTLLPRIKEQLLKAIKITPSSAASHLFLGEVYLALNEERRAFTCFDKVLEIQPNHLEATRHMRIIRMRKDKRKEEEKKKGGLFSRFRKKD